MKIKLVALASLLWLLCFPSLASAQKPQLITPGQVEIKALHGLDGLAVEVEAEVKEDEIKRAVERRLRDARVPAVGADRMHAAVLKVTLFSLGVVTHVRVRLMRFASMTCEGDAFYTAMWEREGLTESPVKELIRLVDLFAADWNSINRR